jgi:hypothetical protein
MVQLGASSSNGHGYRIAAAVPSSGQSDVRINLPFRLSSCVGREQEVDNVYQRLHQRGHDKVGAMRSGK